MQFPPKGHCTERRSKGQLINADEWKFYMLAAIKGRWTKRELERQIRTLASRRQMLGPEKVSPAVTQIHPTAL